MRLRPAPFSAFYFLNLTMQKRELAWKRKIRHRSSAGGGFMRLNQLPFLPV